jgi:hypothetical protein
MRSAYIATTVTGATVRALNYTPEVGRFRKTISDAKVQLLEELATIRTPGSGIFKARDCSPEYGKEFLTQADIFAAETNGRIIQTDLIPDIESRQAKSGQILIAGVGTLGETELYGRAIIVDKRLEGKILSSDILVLEAGLDDDTHAYLYAFLSSKVGVRMVRSTSAGTKLLRPRRDLLRKLPIPIPDDATLKRVAEQIRSTITNRELYLREVQAARACLEALPEMQEATLISQGRKARCAIWDGELTTMTGWTYASLGRALPILRRQWKTKLSDFLEPHGLLHGGRYTRIRCSPPFGVDFLSQRDLFMIRPVPQRIMIPSNDADLRVTEGMILVAGDGQLNEGSLFGQATMVTAELAGVAATEHAVRVKPINEYKELVYAFLSTDVGLRLLRSTAFGTSIPKLSTSLANNLPFPEVTDDLHQAIKNCIQTAMNARVTAANAEKEAVRIIEMEVLPQWLG